MRWERIVTIVKEVTSMQVSKEIEASQPAIAKPPKGKNLEGWATKIRIAKKARSETIRARRGKPATFTDRVVINSTRK